MCNFLHDFSPIYFSKILSLLYQKLLKVQTNLQKFIYLYNLTIEEIKALELLQLEEFTSGSFKIRRQK